MAGLPDISVLEPVIWDQAHSIAACALAEGKTQKEAAADAGVTDRTLRNWLQNFEFSAEVDRLSIMLGAASKAERLRIAKRVIRQKCKDEVVETDKDLLDWVKFVQSETDGVVLNLPMFDAESESKPTTEPTTPPSLAGRGSESPSESIN